MPVKSYIFAENIENFSHEIESIDKFFFEISPLVRDERILCYVFWVVKNHNVHMKVANSEKFMTKSVGINTFRLVVENQLWPKSKPKMIRMRINV